ncbi:MAG TPA: hypothetical protein VEQ11_10130 [Chloroflexota bacterium]|nr:hypothetical protein [Chloroflexota bacterium]
MRRLPSGNAIPPLKTPSPQGEDAHLLVTKAADAAHSRVDVRHLEPSDRLDELAAILGA